MKSLNSINRMALDIGTKYSGICICLNGIIIPQKRVNNKELNDQLEKIINDFDIDEIIIGTPLDRDNNETKMSVWIKSFIKTLKALKSINIIYFNERYTSKEAEYFIKNNIGKKNYKEKIDAISACLILKRFLDEG